MKRKLYLLMVMVLLLGLLPATALAAAPRPPFVTVEDWTLPIDRVWLPIGVFLRAWDVNWRVSRAATVELGYVYCEKGLCDTVVEVTYLVTKDDKYPQELRLTAKYGHWLVPGNCTLQQFVNVRDRSGKVVASAWTPEDHVCMEY